MTSLAQKLSISLPSHLVSFVKEYKTEHHLRSDSEVMALALKNLEKTYLEFCYSQSAQELKKSPELQEESALWDKTAGDGIDNENW